MKSVIVKACKTVFDITTEGIDVAFAAEEWCKLSQEAHRIAGLSTYVRAHPLTSAMRALEHSTKAEIQIVKADIQAAITAAKAELGTTQRALQSLLSPAIAVV